MFLYGNLEFIRCKVDNLKNNPFYLIRSKEKKAKKWIRLSHPLLQKVRISWDLATHRRAPIYYMDSISESTVWNRATRIYGVRNSKFENVTWIRFVRTALWNDICFFYEHYVFVRCRFVIEYTVSVHIFSFWAMWYYLFSINLKFFDFS